MLDVTTDSQALGIRLRVQEGASSFDLDRFICDLLELFEGAACLDLGCGRGKQSLPLAKAIGNRGKLLSIDYSPESVAFLSAELDRIGLSDRVEVVEKHLDDVSEAVKGRAFDRVVGSYSLYYCSHPDVLLSTIRSVMKPDARLVFCGPRHENNFELRNLIAQAGGKNDANLATASSQFMVDIAPPICRHLFDEVSVSPFNNRVVFKSAADLSLYWKSHALFDAAIEEEFDRLAQRHFALNDSFVNTKGGVGVSAMAAA